MAATFKPPATQRVYDVCVLGGGAGGAAAGALLSRRGFRVLLLDTGGAPPAMDGGWPLPAVPSLRVAVKAMPAAEALLAELGLATDAGRALEPLSPDLQVLGPRHRFELSREAAALGAELTREWRADAARLQAGLGGLAAAAAAGGRFLAAAPPLPPGGFLDGFALRKALKVAAQAAGVPRAAVAEDPPLASLDGHPLGAALAALPGFLGHLDGPVAPLSASRLAGAALRGLARPALGAPALEESLARRLSETRGEVLGSAAEPVRIESLAVEGGRLGAIRIAGTPDAFLARVVVLGMPIARLLPLLPREAVTPKAQKVIGRVRPGRRLAALHLAIGPGAMPPGLGPAALVLAAGATAAEAVLVEVGPARRDAAHAGQRLVSAWTLATAQGEDPAAAARLQAALAEALPFHERHVLHRSAPPLAPHLVEVDAPALGVAGLPVRSPWKNLLLASRDVVPGLGLEGELYAGLQAAAHTATLLGAKDKRP